MSGEIRSSNKTLAPQQIEVVTLCSLLIAGYLLLGQITPSYSQAISIDWESKKLVDYPAEINKSTSATVELKNINNILYDYGIEIHATPRQFDDAGILISSLGKPTQNQSTYKSIGDCDLQDARVRLRQLSQKILDNPSLVPKMEGTDYPSVPLSKTLTAWQEVENDPDTKKLDADVLSLGGNPKCNSQEDVKAFLDDFKKTIKSFRDRVALPHKKTQKTVLEHDNDYTISVEESYLGKTTKGGVQEFKFSPVSNIMMLSFGPILSAIEQRSYEVRKFPGMDQNVLAVQGGGALHPVFGSLFNFQLPMPHDCPSLSRALSGDAFGLAATIGPVLGSGGQSGTSNLGFFGGLSIYLWRRLFITPGLHVGEFADFPVGFYPNRPIPANFGELTPLKRWTVRFAFGITLRAKDSNNLPTPPQTSEGKPHNDSVVPLVNLSPKSLTFDSTLVGAKSDMTVTVSNVGGGILNIKEIKSDSNQFASKSDCGSSLAATAKCTITVTFEPTGEVGARTGTLTIVDNGSSSPEEIALSGTAQKP